MQGDDDDDDEDDEDDGEEDDEENGEDGDAQVTCPVFFFWLFLQFHGSDDKLTLEWLNCRVFLS